MPGLAWLQALKRRQRVTKIANCAAHRWAIGIGDPGVMGWLIVALYALTAVVALRVAVRGRFPPISARRERRFWVILGVILLALGLNKQLDLQSLLTTTARCMAELQGWYATRRAVQIWFIVTAVLAMLILFALMGFILRGTLRRSGLALTGLVFVLGFVAIRAAGFHHMDQLINVRLGTVRTNWLLEMIGPVLILIGSGINLRATRAFT